jgi:hypothetical protein
MHDEKHLVAAVFAILTASCSVEIDGSEERTVSEEEPVLALGPGGEHGGSQCGPILELDGDGALVVVGYLCPVPRAPLPDPERSVSPLARPDEWVKAAWESPQR